jgi:hypothetical protein
MQITLTESQEYDIDKKDAKRFYSISYCLGDNDVFEASQELIEKKLSCLCYDKEGCIEIISIIDRDYKKSLQNKENNILDAQKFNDELQGLYSSLTFNVKAYN